IVHLDSGMIRYFVTTTVRTFCIYESLDDYPDTARIIINLNMKTEKSGSRNASLSMPVVWPSGDRAVVKWGTGEYVCAIVENGYVRKLIPVSSMKAKILTAAEVDKKNQQAIEAQAQIEAQDKPKGKSKVEKELQVVEAESIEEKAF